MASATGIRAASTLCLAVLLFFPAVVGAQARVTGGDLRGWVQDPSGGRLPGVIVTARSQATNIARDSTTDGTGRFVLLALEPGDYSVTAASPGFVPGVRDRVRIQIGELVELPFELALAAVSESVTVVAAAPIVNARQASVATVIDEREVADIPINGRRFIDLAAMAAGVTSPGAVDLAANTPGFSILGQRPVSNNFLVDGFDNSDRILGGANASFSQESVREFQVLTGSYPAEFGNAAGGVVNIVTRSGTNTHHGSAFLFVRHDGLNARNHFERFDPFGAALGRRKAPFSQRQYGGTMGVPLRRDRTFLFAAAERSATSASNFVTIDPATAAVLSAAGFPVEGGHQAYDSNTGQIVARLDHYWKPVSTLVLRAHASDLADGNYVPFGGLVARSRSARLARRDWGAAASQTNVMGNRWVNEARMQVVRQTHTTRPFDPTGPGITLVGLASAGRSDLDPTERTSRGVQAKNTLTLSAARHTAKAGAELMRISNRSFFSYNFGGSYVFVSLPAATPALPASLGPLEAFAAGLPALYVQGYGDGLSSFDYTGISAFVQDEWRVGGRLTLSGGLRYQQQRFPDFDVTVSDLGGARLTYPFPLSSKHLSPRVGGAFDPAGDGRTSIHGAYGLFFGEQLTTIYGLTNIFGRTAGTRLHVFPFPYSLAGWSAPAHVLPEGAIPAPPVTFTVGPDADTPRTHQASAGLMRQVGGNAALWVEAVYARGSHNLGALDYNPLVPTLGNGRRPNDVAGVPGTSATVVQYTDFGETWYRGLLVTFQKRLARGQQLRAAYTWSRAEDNSARFAGLVNDNGRGRNPAAPGGLPLGFDPATEKGPADSDQRHRIVLSGLYTAPLAVQLSTIFSVASGLPFTPLAGADLNADGIPDADRPRSVPVDPATAAGRNSARFPGHATLDLRVARPMRVAGRATLTPIVDVFNLFNRTNFTEVNNVFGTGRYPDEPLRDAGGRVTYGLFQKALAPRQVQIAARLSF